MHSSKMQEILKSDYEKYKSFLNTNKFAREPNWEDYFQLNKALQCGQKDLAKRLILGGARVNKDNTCRPLHLAVSLGCSEIVKMLIDKGALTHSKNNNNETPLISAAKMQRLSIVDLLLSAPNQINCSNTDGLSHMHIACMRNRVDVIKQLIQSGSVISDQVRGSFYWPGYTLLHFAVHFQAIETVQFLLDYGANITDKDSAGLTALHHAHMLRNEFLIDLILSFHTDKTHNAVDEEGMSHFHIACSRNKPNIVGNFIKRGTNINTAVKEGAINWAGYTPLTFAIEFECVDVVRLLLAHNAHLNIQNYTCNIMQLAYKTMNQEIIDMLASRNSIEQNKKEPQKVEKKDFALKDDFSTNKELRMLHEIISLNKARDGSLCSLLSVVNVVIRENCAEVIKKLCAQNGVDLTSTFVQPKLPSQLTLHRTRSSDTVNSILSSYVKFDKATSSDDGLSLFHIACAINETKVIGEFLDNGANIDAQVSPDSMKTPGFSGLHFAVTCHAEDAVKLLLERGADIGIKDKFGHTALDVAILGFHLNYNQFVKEYTNLPIVDLLLSAAESLDCSSMEDRGFTHLHVACMKNDAADVEQLLDARPDMINKPVNWAESRWHGYTPLHFAIHFIRRAVIDLLLLRGADVSAKNGAGDTPLHLAIEYNTNIERKNLINAKLLITEDNPTGVQGYSHFHVACELGNLEAVRYFLNRGIDVNERTKLVKPFSYQGRTPLHFAYEKYRVNKPPPYPYEDKTPLHLACENYQIDTDLVVLLLDSGAEIDARDLELNTPLHGAECHEVMQILLERGAQADALNLYRQTPLLTICTPKVLLLDERGPDVIEVLLEYRADVNAESEDGTTALNMWRRLSSDLHYLKDNTLPVLLRHVTKLKAMGGPVSKRNQREYKRLMQRYARHNERTLERQCQEELERMARVKLNSEMTLLDMLLIELNGLATYSVNDSFRRLAETLEGAKQEFPLYGYLLRLQFRRGVKRRLLLERAEVALGWLMGLRLRMPVDCLERILRDASNDDLRNVIAAANVQA